MAGVFVVGTDTGIGKTLTCVALLHALRHRGIRAVGMKPVAAGAMRVLAGWVSEDALALRAASSVPVPPGLDSPVVLREPVSPHIAARRAGLRVSIEAIARSYAELTHVADAVVVEGAGGFLVPLDDQVNGGHLAQALGLPIVLVVGLRLGCLNHAVLTSEAIRARGLALVGWVCNRVDANMLWPDDNIDYLLKNMRAPLLADIPFQPNPDARLMASRIRLPAVLL